MDLAEIRVARTQVRLYTSMRPMYSIEQSGSARRHALSASCEDILQLGINAFEWLKRAEKRWTNAIQAGRIQYDPESQAAFDRLFSAWLEPCKWAEEKISLELATGSVPENLESFRSCCTEAAEIVAKRAAENSQAEREEHELAIAGRRALSAWAKENAP
jgi:hypothetical protein